MRCLGLLAAIAIFVLAAGPSMAQSIPDVPDPTFSCEGSAEAWASSGIPCTCVNGQVTCDTSSGDSSSGSSYDSGESYEDRRSWIDYWREQAEQRRIAAEQKRKQEAFDLNEQGNRAYERGDWATSVDLYKKALKKSPYDTVIQQNLKNAETEKQRADDARKAKSEYRKRMAKLAALMPAAKPLSSGGDKQKAGASSVKVPFPGFSPEKWKEYLDAEDVVNRLYAKLNREGSLSDEDSNTFYAALKHRNELWAAATAQPMTDADRDGLRLSLPIVINRKIMNLATIMSQIGSGGQSGTTASQTKPVSSPDRRAGAAGDGRTSKADAITSAFVADFSANKATKYMAMETGNAIEEDFGEKLKGKFGNLLGIAKIAVKAREGGAPKAGAETVDFMVSKMPESMSARAEMAKEGGRMYSKVVYRAFYKFLQETEPVTGVDPDTFMKQFDESNTQSQKGIREWVEFGK